MVKPTDIELIYEFFEFAPRYRGRNPEKFNITSYVGKHILEHHRAEGYMARQEFEDCMEHLNINTFKNSDEVLSNSIEKRICRFMEMSLDKYR